MKLNDCLQEDWIQDDFHEEFGLDDDSNRSSTDDGGENPNNADHDIPQNDTGFNRLLEMLSTDECNETIDAPIVVSKAEIFLCVIKYAYAYCLSHTAVADLFKMLNCFFGFSFLPGTRYLVDKLFSTESGVRYHAICPECNEYVCEFDRKDKQVICNNCETVIELKDPLYNKFFAIMNVNNEIANLIETNHEYYDYVVRDRPRNDGKFSEMYDGVLYKKFVDSLSENDRYNYASALFNTDGSPCFKSSKFSIWPIQIIINELPFAIRSCKTIVCGIWFGKDKPDMNTFLKPFVSQFNQLSTVGIQCTIGNEKRCIKVFPLCAAVDSVARPPMQGLVQYNGYFGCS